MGSRRQERVTELIQQEISKRVLRLKDPGIGFITIIAVRLTPDFHQAKIFYSVLGTEDERRRTQEALERAKNYLRSELRSLESLKYPPELVFVLDTTFEETQRVLDTLSQLERERQTQDKPSPVQAPPRKKNA